MRNLLNVTNGLDGVYVIDISTPRDISIIEHIDTPGYSNGLRISGDLLFIADGYSGVQIYDIHEYTIITTTTTATTTTITTSTTSTSVLPQPCPLEEIYGGYSEETKFLRYFRDKILNQTPEGHEIIRLYYKWSPAIVKIMMEDGVFKGEVKEIIDSILPIIREEVK